jgi:hypothetical protein
VSKRHAGTDYQALATGYTVGDLAVPYGAARDYAGRVVAVWPAIGMVDLQFPEGTKRYPVEALQRFDKGPVFSEDYDSVPGGAGTVPVSQGPFEQGEPLVRKRPDPKVVSRVATAFVKQSLYWGARDRRYRCTHEEMASGQFNCPKCHQAPLRKVIYRRESGRSEKLFCCPSCLFLIERSAILNAEAE